MLPSGAFVRSLFNLQDTRPLLRNIHYSTTNALHCQELFSRFLTFYRKPLWLPPLRTAYLGYHSRGRLSRTFFGSFQTFSLRSPAAHLPANSLFTLPHSPPLVNDFFPYFQLFSTLCNPCQNLGLYLPCHRTLFLPLTFMIHYSYIGRMLDRVRHGVDSPKAFCFCPIPSAPQKFLAPAFSAGVCAIGGHDIYFVLTGSSPSCGSTMPYHDISMISLFHVAYPLLCLHLFLDLHSLPLLFLHPPL